MEKHLRTKMDITVEFDPKKTVFILGPSVIRLCIDTSNSDPNALPLDYTAVCEEGIKHALSFVQPDECTNKRRLLQNACELNPLYAAHEVTSILTRNGVYETWLMLLHKKMSGLSGQNMYTKHFALQFLSAMNQKGALLATTCYVEVLEQVLNLKPVSLTEADINSKVLGNGGWPNSLLHIYGMFSQPDTVVFDFLAEKPVPSLTKEGRGTLKLFLQRNLLFVGFDDENFDQAAQRFVELVSSQLSYPGAMLPVFLSLTGNTSSSNNLLDGFLKVFYGEKTSLSVFHQILYASGTNTDEPNFMKEFHIQSTDHNTRGTGGMVATNLDNMLSLIIHEKDKPDVVMGGILSIISKSTSLRLESVSYAAKVGQLRQVVLRFSTNGVLKLSQLILTNQLDLITYDVVALQLANGPLIWIQNRSQIARCLTATASKGDISPAFILKSAASVEEPVAIQHQQQRSPHQYVSSPPPLWPVTSTVPKTPTKGETTPDVPASSIIALPPKNLPQSKASGKLSPLTLPTSPLSPEALSSASPFSTASTPAKYLSIVSGKHRAGLPEELDPYLSIECYDQLTKKLVPMHASMHMIANEAEINFNGASQHGGSIASASPKAASPLLNSSAVQSLSLPANIISPVAGSKSQPEKSPTKLPIQPITLTHKYQENKQARQAKKYTEPSLGGSKSSSESPNGGSNNDLSTITPPTTKALSGNSEIMTPVLKSPLPAHTMLNAANLAVAAAAAGVSLPTAIPQPFSLPIMFHPTFTPTTPGTQLPFVYPSALTPLGMNSPLSALQQFPMLSQAHPSQYMMVDCPTFVWPPSSKIATGGSGFNFMMPPNSSVLQTPPSSAIQEKVQNRKRSTPPPATVDGHAQAPTFGTETSPKKPRTDSIPSSNCPLSQVVTPLSFTSLTTTATTAATPLTVKPDAHSGIIQTGDTSNNESGSESESKDNGDSDSEDDVVTCLQEPAPIEGTNNLPPFPNGRGVVQLWQFLLDMLLTPDKNYMIQWTGNEYEFTILQPDDIAALWGERKGKPRMNYDKLSRGLRYYYSKGIMDKVPGKKLTFKFTCNVEDYVRTRSSNPNAVQTLRAIIRNSKQGHDSEYSSTTVAMSS